MTLLAHAHYQATATQTAAPEQLVLMMYDGAIQRIELATEVLEDPEGGDHEVAHTALVRSQAILDELRVSLDRQRGGRVADNLAELYAWCVEQLVEANLRKDPAPLAAVLRIVGDLREAWNRACITGWTDTEPA